MAENDQLMEKIVSLCKRRGFVFPGSEIYGGLANSWDYGPLGVELKNNIKQLWWKRFVQQRDDMVGIDAALIMNPKVWEASGHVATFNDPLVECKKCHNRFRPDQIEGIKQIENLPEEYPAGKDVHADLGSGQSIVGEDNKRIFISENTKCPNCGQKFELSDKPKQFNLMFKTHIGPVESDDNIVYLRPETAQAMFVDFKNVLDTSRKQLPFGIGQIGKAFRNEITPGNFIFRTREFEQMEIEYFFKPPQNDEEWNKVFEMWRAEMKSWIMDVLGIKWEHIHELEVPKADLAHYSKRTIDFEYHFPFGVSELYGLAYRTDFDLKNHMDASKQDIRYTDPQTGEKTIPHCIEPTWGVDRSVLAVLCEAYDDSNPENIILHLPPKLAPYKVAVFPLLKNKPELVAKAKSIYDELRQSFNVAWDDRGNVGKRYYSQDEIGTPFCVTVDFDTIEKDGCVTVRDRDTKDQPRVKIEDLKNYIINKL
jgi:glycyl-tRNA synthetase